jgi:penicillin-binding protein 2
MMDGSDSVRYREFTRRSMLAGAGMAGFFALIMGRTYQLSVLQGAQFNTLAEDNRINLQLLAPPRGRIYDRFGAELAGNGQNYRILLTPDQSIGVEATLDLIAQLIPLTSKQRARILRDVQRGRPFKPVLVAEGLSWDEFARVNVNMPSLPGIAPDSGEMRSYPAGPELGHVLGYVGGVTDKDVAEDPQLISLPGYRIGRAGVERFADKQLRGDPGAAQFEVNARGQVLRELSRRPGKPGNDLVLTIDHELQKFTHERLWGQSASAVVMDVHTGELIVLVSAPGFDPNAFLNGPTPEVWSSLRDDPKKPLFNKPVQGTYPPGSTFKPVTALAALTAGAVTPEETIFCSGSTRIGRQTFHCWARRGHGSMNLNAALKYSCDCYFYEVGRRAGIDNIGAMARSFGLGQTYGLEIPGEKGGLVPDPNWKLAVRKQKWTQGETFNVSIGQGALLTTPLQLCVMTARLANGGLAVQPRLIRAAAPDATQVALPPEALAVDPALVKLVQDGMDAVTNEGGTAARSRIGIEGYEMAGKTGTAQVRRITRAERARGVRKNDELPWELRDHALFIAYAPVTAPKYAISVIVDHGGGGSTTAAPIARDIMTEVLRRDPSAKPAFSPAPPERT